jgi:hypothetical protein
LQRTVRRLPCCLFSALQIVDTRELISSTALRKVTILLSCSHCCATFSTNTETCCERMFLYCREFRRRLLIGIPPFALLTIGITVATLEDVTCASSSSLQVLFWTETQNRQQELCFTTSPYFRIYFSLIILVQNSELFMKNVQ